jgi:hypothetical protein
MIASFARQTVTRLRAATGTDSYNNPIVDWGDPDPLDISPVIVQPISGSETFDTQGGVLVSRWSLHADADADIADGDRIVYGDDTYDIDGAVQVFPSPSGRLGHVEVMLKRRDDA